MENDDEKVQKICEELDDLTLKQVDLLDEQLTLISKLESHMTHGFINLAKSRYIGGETSVSMTKIPGEESDIGAAAKIVRGSSSQLEIQRDPEAADPIKWFGVLVPASLRQSQQSFQKVLETAVDIVNARNQWLETMEEKSRLVAVTRVKNTM